MQQVVNWGPQMKYELRTYHWNQSEMMTLAWYAGPV